MKCCISRDIALIKPINKAKVLLSLVYYKNIQEYRPINFLRIISRFHGEFYVRLCHLEFNRQFEPLTARNCQVLAETLHSISAAANGVKETLQGDKSSAIWEIKEKAAVCRLHERKKYFFLRPPVSELRLSKHLSYHLHLLGSKSPLVFTLSAN